MKKSLLMLLCGATLVAMTTTSCKEDKRDQPMNTQRLRASLPSVIIPVDNEQPAQLVTAIDYGFTYDFLNSTWSIELAELNITNDDKLSFTSPSIYASGDYNLRLRYNSGFSAKNGATISDISATITSNYYWPGISNTTQSMPIGNIYSVSFNVTDKYTVRSFPRIACYGGTTRSQFNDNEESSSTEALYTATIDLNTKTAEIIIQNAKFAPGMPTIASMRLPGLSIREDREKGYVISGKNIVPKVGEGLHETDYPNFTFDEIEFYPNNKEITQAYCNFTVAGRYKGAFAGSWIK